MSKSKRSGVKSSTRVKSSTKAKPKKPEFTGVIILDDVSYPRDEITSGTLFRVFNGRAVVDATITYTEPTKWSALVRLSIDANEIRHRFTDTRSISSESHEVAMGPREGILLAMLQMCINRLGTFAEVEIAENERDRLVGELMRAGFDDAARKVGSW